MLECEARGTETCLDKVFQGADELNDLELNDSDERTES